MHCGVMVTGYNQGDWERLLAGDYDRPPTVPDATQFDATLTLGELVEPLGFDSIWATEHYGSAYSMQPNPLQYLAYWAGAHVARRRGDRSGRGAVVEPGAARERAVDARHPLAGQTTASRTRPGSRAPRVRVARRAAGAVTRLLLRDRRHPARRRRVRALLLRRRRLSRSTDHHPAPGPAQGRADRSTSRSRVRARQSARLAAEHGLGQMFVADDNLEQMATKIARFNGIRAELGLPPTSRPRCCGCTARRPRRRPRRAGSTTPTRCEPSSTTTSSGTTPASKASRAWSTT